MVTIQIPFSGFFKKHLCRMIPFLLLGIPVSCFSQNDGAGTTFFDFLKLSYDARSAALGGAGVGMPMQIYGIPLNPATLSYGTQRQAAISYHPILADVRAGALAFSSPIKRAGTFAGSIVYLSSGRFDGVDENNDPTGITYSPYSMAGSVSWAKIVAGGAGIGVSIKGIYDNLGYAGSYSADGLVVDMGGQYRLYSDRLIFGLSIKNLGFVLSNYSEDSPDPKLPFSASAGFSFVPKNISSLRFALDMCKATDDYLAYRGGLEIAVYQKNVFIRGGTEFSHRDLVHVFRVLRQTDESDYQKFDAAFRFRVDGLPLEYILSMNAGF
jgi:hypothetical protein